MSFPPQLLALGVILLFGLALYLAIRTSRRHQSEADHQLQQLGFHPLESSPPELERRVEELYQTKGEREIDIWRVYHRHELDEDLFLFDAVDTRGDGSEMGSGVFGMISPNLALPRFSLVTMPGFNRDSLIGGLMDKLLDKVMDYAEGYLQLERVDLTDHPDQDDQVVLFGRSPTAVREMLDRVGLYSLLRNSIPLQIAGSGEFITVDISMSNNPNQPEENLVSRYQTCVEITRRFMK